MRSQAGQLQLPIVTPERGREHVDAAIALWLSRHGLSARWRPRPRYSGGYCRWLDRAPERRDRELYDALTIQRWVCWHCGTVAGARMDLHHASGYDNLGQEAPTELVAVHRGKCHREAHDALMRERQLMRRWFKAA